MMRMGRGLGFALLLVGLAGCETFGPLMRDGPALIPAGSLVEADQNPVFIPPFSYGQLFETAIRVLSDYDFEIAESNRYDGRIETLPRTAPGLEFLIRPGSPDLYDRLLETLQSYRHRISVVIQPADNGGYFVEIIARKELEDLPQPVRSTVGGAVFRTLNNVDRQFEVIDPAYFDSKWIFRGRDVPLEQELIRRLKRLLSGNPPTVQASGGPRHNADAKHLQAVCVFGREDCPTSACLQPIARSRV